MKFSGLAAAVALALALTACNGEPEPKFADPTETPTSESTETSSPTDKPKGPRAEERAFVREYIRALSESISTGQPGSFVAMSTDSCTNCRTFARNIRSAYRDGGQIENGRWTLTTSRYKGEIDETGDSLWFLEVESTRETWLDGRGDVVNVVREGTQFLAASVRRESGVLAMSDLTFREP